MTILDQPWQIELYRLNVLKYGLRLEVRNPGMKASRNSLLQSANVILMRNGRIDKPCRTKADALTAIEAYITDKEQEAITKGLMSDGQA